MIWMLLACGQVLTTTECNEADAYLNQLVQVDGDSWRTQDETDQGDCSDAGLSSDDCIRAHDNAEHTLETCAVECTSVTRTAVEERDYDICRNACEVNADSNDQGEACKWDCPGRVTFDCE